MIKTPTGDFHVQPLHKGKIYNGDISKQPHIVKRLSDDKFESDSIEAVFKSDRKHKQDTHHHKKGTERKNDKGSKSKQHFLLCSLFFYIFFLVIFVFEI